MGLGKFAEDETITAVTLSSKGQMVIPKEIREALGLKPGTRLCLRVSRHRLVLEPAKVLSPHQLRGILAGTDALRDLEIKHEAEVVEDGKKILKVKRLERR